MFYFTNVFKKVYLFIFILLKQNNISFCCSSDCCNSCRLGGNIHEIIDRQKKTDTNKTNNEIRNNINHNENVNEKENTFNGFKKIEEINEPLKKYLEPDDFNLNCCLINEYIKDEGIDIKKATINLNIDNTGFDNIYKYDVEYNGVKKEFITKKIRNLNNLEGTPLAEFIDSSSILILQEILTILGLFELNSKYKKNNDKGNGFFLIKKNFDENEIKKFYENNRIVNENNTVNTFKNLRLFYFFSGLLNLDDYNILKYNNNVYVKDGNLKFIFPEINFIDDATTFKNVTLDENNKYYFLEHYFFRTYTDWKNKKNDMIQDSDYCFFQVNNEKQLKLGAISYILLNSDIYFTPHSNIAEIHEIKKRINFFKENYACEIKPIKRMQLGIIYKNPDDFIKFLKNEFKIEFNYYCCTLFTLTKILEKIYDIKGYKNINEFIEFISNYIIEKIENLNITDNFTVKKKDITKESIKKYINDNLENAINIIKVEKEYADEVINSTFDSILDFTNEEKNDIKNKLIELEKYIKDKTNSTKDRTVINILDRINSRIDEVKTSGVFKEFFSY